MTTLFIIFGERTVSFVPGLSSRKSEIRDVSFLQPELRVEKHAGKGTTGHP